MAKLCRVCGGKFSFPSLKWILWRSPTDDGLMKWNRLSSGRWRHCWECSDDLSKVPVQFKTGPFTSDALVCVSWKWRDLWREVPLFMIQHTRRKGWWWNLSLSARCGHFKWVGELRGMKSWGEKVLFKDLFFFILLHFTCCHLFRC